MEAGLIFKRVLHRQPSGTTFIELMVASTVFLLLMGVIMSFYISGAKVTRQQDQRSDTMRRALNITDKFETLLKDSRLIWVGVGENEDKPQVLIFTPLEADTPLPVTANGPKWSQKAETIYYDAKSQTPQFILVNGEGKERPLGRLKKGETATITADSDSVTIRLALLYYPHKDQTVPDPNEVFVHERIIPIVNVAEY